MNTELKKCARCGGEAFVYFYTAVTPETAPVVREYYVKCPHCIGENTPLFMKEADAIKWWNDIVAARKIEGVL